MNNAKCFDIFKACIHAIHDGKLIIPESSRDKEFHFQNWCQQRIEEAELRYDIGGRNTYPDFKLVEHTEGYEVKGFGTYGDILIRDRKMYVVPTPFALTNGTTGLSTLIVPTDFYAPSEFICVGELIRIESKNLVVGYNFDLTNNELEAKLIENPNAGKKHVFKAYRHHSQTNKPVCMA